jgi:hypothetical protein
MKDARDELVRIDAQGVAHPIGVVASQRMRARAGAYRILPAPAHVAFLRYTGEDGRRDAEDGAVVRLAGEVTAPAALCDVLALLAQTGWRGELVVLDGETSRSIFFDAGKIVGAVTTRAEERLGAVLYKYGAVSDEQLARVQSSHAAGKRFGECAVELGVLTQEQVYFYIGKQVEEVVFAALTVGDGTFFFLDGFDEARLASRHAVSANALLMDGVTRLDELRYFRQKIPTSDYLPLHAEGRAAPAEFEALWQAVDGRRNIEELGRVTGLGEFETTKQVYALLQSKHLQLVPPRLSGGPAALVESANAALRSLLAAADAAHKGEDVRASMASFAVGAGVYDILFRGAGPDAMGSLDAARVAENAVIIASGTDAENVLKQMLYEYVSFALFSAGAALPELEASLKKQLAPVLTQLGPVG